MSDVSHTTIGWVHHETGITIYDIKKAIKTHQLNAFQYHPYGIWWIRLDKAFDAYCLAHHVDAETFSISLHYTIGEGE